MNECHKMQQWQKLGFEMYAKRIPAEIILTESIKFKQKESKHNSKKYIISLDRRGKQCSSLEMSQLIEQISQHSSHIIFIIGPANGLTESEIKQSDTCWSLSQLTFPHQLTKIILIEQLYRAYSILSKHPYHK
ncbi:MAG: 23S rRNA (pseudouridine(1915)-N(3))-methyltransferase RlmH [Pseudomonadota bacterium]|nr:23S rRNA (pseudouridine(1915)-N(3))-methyltransferase RlmH [Pseudomonadota bacterium]